MFEAFTLIAGPCVLEDDALNLRVGRELRRIGEELGLPIVFKASYDKANRSKLDAPRGPGLDAGLDRLARVKGETGLPVLTDVHEPWQAERAGGVVDVLQIPAFLCRQTDLLVAAGGTGRAVNVKKGQWMAPEEMEHAVHVEDHEADPPRQLGGDGTARLGRLHRAPPVESAARTARTSRRRSGRRSRGSMLAPSEGARAGSGCVSRKRPSQPAATAARTREGMCSGSPPLAPSAFPGRWTEWVPSKMAGAPQAARSRAKERMSTTRFP